MSKKDSKDTENKTRSSPDSVLREAIFATGQSPKTVKEPSTERADSFVGKSHEGAQKAVKDFCRSADVGPVSMAPITSDGQRDVDASGKDYREVVHIGPHLIHPTSGGHETRFNKTGRDKSPGSYRGAKPMADYKNKPEWMSMKGPCQAPRFDGSKDNDGLCGKPSRKGSKFCTHPHCQPQKHGKPDYRDDPKYNSVRGQPVVSLEEEDEGPLPERLQKPTMWVWGNFYTPFHWMVLWVFSVMMSARGIFGSAICSSQLLMRYMTHSPASKWRWKHVIAMLSDSMNRSKPLLGVYQVCDVLGTHEQTRRTHKVEDFKLSERIAKGTASRNDKGKWSGRNGLKWYKEAKRKWDYLVTNRWEQNCLSAYLDPEGINARCEGLADIVKDDGTPNISAAKRKFGKQLVTLSEIKKAGSKIPAYFKSSDYEFNITKATKLLVAIGESKQLISCSFDEFVDKYVKSKATEFAGKYNVFYLVDNKARKPRGSKKGIQWVEDPVIIQCATYVVDDEARLYLGVGRRTKSGELTGPFEAQFLRTRKRSKFAHMWNADDELDVIDVLPKRNIKREEQALIARLEGGETLTLDDLLELQV